MRKLAQILVGWVPYAASVRRGFGLWCLLTLVACSTPTTSGTGGTPKCVPGKTDACICNTGGAGVQTCGAAGTWGPCACAGAPLTDAASDDADTAASDDSEDDAGTDVGALQSGDGVSVSTDVDPDALVSEACDPCGYGSVKGLICSPSDKSYVAGATVTLTVVDCDGTTKEISTKTAADGSYSLAQVPCGSHTALVTAGKFSASYTVAVTAGQETDLSGVGTRLCFTANSAKIAVWWGQWDEQNGILDKLGFNYTYYNYKADWMADVPPKDIPACQALQDLSELKKYDILFFNCGSEVKEWISAFPSIAKNLRTFVEEGGSIYGSDLAWASVEAPFPDAIDFYGKTDLPGGPSNDGPQVVEGNQKAPATIVDPALAAFVGATSFQSSYGPGPLIAIQDPGPGTTVHVTTKVKIPNPAYNSNPFLPKFLDFTGPAVVSHKPPNLPNAGRVVYTTFHNDEQADALMQNILNYLVFLL